MWLYSGAADQDLSPCGAGANFPVPCTYMLATPLAVMHHLGVYAVLCCAVLCCAALCCAALCCAVLCCAVLRCAVLRCDALCVLCCAALRCVVFASTVLF